MSIEYLLLLQDILLQSDLKEKRGKKSIITVKTVAKGLWAAVMIEI